VITIYGLSSSRDGQIRYIGKTSETIQQRLVRHLSNHQLNEGYYKCRWLKKELRDGHQISIEEIDLVTEDDWQFWEKYWIRQFRAWGFSLTNTSDGGEGVTGHDVVERRIKTRMRRVRKQRADEILKYGIKEFDGYTTGSRVCNHCQGICHYKHDTMTLLLAAIRKAVSNNRRCQSCIGAGNPSPSKSFVKGGWNPKRGGNKGSENTFFGKKHKKESLKQAVATRKTVLNIPDVVQMKLDGTVINTFPTIREAARVTGVSRSGIMGCCNGKRSYHSAGGFKWSYAQQSTLSF
jgi:group I intron endonuclease